VHTNSQAPSPATTIAERLSGGEPYIITFGGQATPWRQTLADLVSLDHALAADVVAVDRAVAEAQAELEKSRNTLQEQTRAAVDKDGSSFNGIGSNSLHLYNRAFGYPD